MDNTLTCITDAINALENKPILTTPGFHLSLTNFTLSPTLTYFPHLSLDNKLPHSLFLHSDWPSDSWLIIYSPLLIIILNS